MTPATDRGSWRFGRFLLMAILGVALSGRGSTSAIGSQGLGEVNRADPCDHLPDPPGAAKGIHQPCDVSTGSSSGIAKGDFNGDGVADLAIGIPGRNVTVNLSFPASTASRAGAVQIIYGTTADGLQTAAPAPQLLTEARTLVLPADARAETNDQFGGTLAAGDFDDDGFSDLAVGIPGETTTTTAVGAVAVFKGSATGLSTSIAAFFGPNVFSSATNPGNSHGAGSLTWGDFNGDGFGDLAVASDYTIDFQAQNAAATVLFGSAAGLSTQGKQRFELEHLNLASHPTAPLVLSAGDFNKDGFFDLVAGSPQSSVSALSIGNVHILPGSGSGPDFIGQSIFDESSAGVPSEPTANEQFGSALAVGDFNGDTFDDLAIGVPFERNDTTTGPAPGAVIVLPGSFFGLQAVGTPGAQILVGGGGRFGAALAANAFDSDAIKDLAVGSPSASFTVLTPITNGQTQSQTITAGMVEVIFGTSNGLSRTAGRAPQRFSQSAPSGTFGMPSNVTQLPASVIESGDGFGSSLTAWNFGRSARPDLAIGAPFEALGTVTEAGAVHVIYGSSTGLTATGAQLWTENSAGLGTTASAGDHFGLTVY